MTTQRSDLISAAEAARALGLSHSGLWRIMKAGYLPGRKVGHNYVIDSDAFAEFSKKYVKGAHRNRHAARQRRRG